MSDCKHITQTLTYDHGTHVYTCDDCHKTIKGISPSQERIEKLGQQLEEMSEVISEEASSHDEICVCRLCTYEHNKGG